VHDKSTLLRTQRQKQEPAIKVIRALYGLKKFGQMWFERFTDKMIAMGFTHDDIPTCLFIRNDGNDFVMVAIYVK
jgi:hypothetical protein